MSYFFIALYVPLTFPLFNAGSTSLASGYRFLVLLLLNILSVFISIFLSFFFCFINLYISSALPPLNLKALIRDICSAPRMLQPMGGWTSFEIIYGLYDPLHYILMHMGPYNT